MYFETHIIVGEPVAESPADEGLIRKMASNHGFWCSVLNQDESNEERAGDMILTTRDQMLEDAKVRISELVYALHSHGVPVRRYKVEHAVLDSKLDDALMLGINRSSRT